MLPPSPPLAPPPEEPLTTPSRQAVDAEPVFLRLRAAIVDDDALCRSLTRDALADYLGAVSEAEDGPGALELLAEERFDLVIIDDRMPGLSGQAVIRALANAGIEVPIILLTGADPLGLAPDRGRPGVVVVPKPVDVALLRRAARGVWSEVQRARTPPIPPTH